MDSPSRAGGRAREQYERLAAARLRRAGASGLRPSELSWLRGAEGEEAVGEVLGRWAQMCGLGVLHDVVIPGSRANIDHIVVGARGVAVIDTKNWTGPVQLRGDSLRIGRWNKQAALRGVQAQADLVRGVLREHGIEPLVQGVLCLAARNEGVAALDVMPVNGVWVGTPEAVAYALSAGDAWNMEKACAALRVIERHFGAVAVSTVGDVIVTTRVRPARARRARKPRDRTSGRITELIACGVGALVMLVIASALLQLRESGRLSHQDVTAMATALRARAAEAAGGPVRGPHATFTEARVHLRYRRNTCRVRLSLNRETARVAEDAVLVLGQGC